MDCKFNEIHFVHLNSQSNIYGFSWFRTIEALDSAKLLVASLKKPIICFEFNNKPFEDLVPSSKEIHFTYIPGGAEIISIDSFNKSLTSNDFTVGITFSKERTEDQPAAYYLNIYTEWEPKAEMSLESISQSCLSLELKFIPYKLYHTRLPNNEGSMETIWLLSGNDEEVHLFREEKGHTYVEQNVRDCFPEFDNLPSIVLCMDIVDFERSPVRLTAFGCEDGYIRVCLVDTSVNIIEKELSIQHDSPISCVKLFKWRNDMKPPSFLPNRTNPTNESEDLGSFNLLVISTLEVAVVYWRFLVDDLKDQKILPGSDQCDTVQCACVADVDMDGANEIVIGTYGRQLMVYKCEETISLPSLSAKKNDNSPPNPSSNNSKEHFNLLWQRQFAYPILAVDYFDVTGDGLKELVVLSTKGLHILQHNLDEVCSTLTTRMKLYLGETLNESSDEVGEDEDDS